MDWSKAKTILIWAFLLLDLFLGYQVYVSRNQHWFATETYQGYGGELEEVLAERKIQLQTEIPQETPTMNYLNAEYRPLDSIDSEKLANRQMYVEKSSIIAELAPPIEIKQTDDPEENSRRLASAVKHMAEYVPDSLFSSEQELWWWQTHEGVPLYTAPLRVSVQDGKAVRYQQTYLHVFSKGMGRQVISARTALRSLVEKEYIQSGEKVEDISLGYYGHEYDAVIQVLAPVWRIVHGGYIHYVNAFTGAVERPIEEILPHTNREK